MISIIISSCSPENFSAIQGNIFKTIGVEYEIIKIDNPGLMGICEAYNKGIKLAKYNVLCFSHEDVEFKTQGWGKKILDIFGYDKEIGLIGIAGSSYLPYVYSGWWFPKLGNLKKKYLIQSGKNKRGDFVDSRTNKNINFEEVVVIDGCFMVTKKTDETFDESLFKSYHCYDLDFSMQKGLSKKVIVTYEIILEHFSGGALSYAWFEETIKFNKKWQTHLPLKKSSLTAAQISKEEISAYWIMYNFLLKGGYSIKPILKYFIDRKFIRLIGLKNHLLLVFRTIKFYSRKVENIYS